MKARGAFWLGACAFVVLGGRAFAYELAPHQQLVGTRLEGTLGGPSFVVTAVAAPAVALVVAAALVWLATVGVRERHLLAGGPSPERLRLGRITVNALLLWFASCAVFGALESYLHWRAGLGFHGIHCLVGPVHRDAIPVLAALSVIAAAGAAAAQHVWRWLRRTWAGLTRTRASSGLRSRIVRTAVPRPASPLLPVGRRTRGPPSLAVTR